jgi:hypothetical protein
VRAGRSSPIDHRPSAYRDHPTIPIRQGPLLRGEPPTRDRRGRGPTLGTAAEGWSLSGGPRLPGVSRSRRARCDFFQNRRTGPVRWPVSPRSRCIQPVAQLSAGAAARTQSTLPLSISESARPRLGIGLSAVTARPQDLRARPSRCPGGACHKSTRLSALGCARCAGMAVPVLAPITRAPAPYRRRLGGAWLRRIRPMAVVPSPRQ